MIPGGNWWLSRYHEHTNALEGDTFFDFHIHTATERYMRSGHREDAYAEVTDRYSDFKGAVACMFEDCVLPQTPDAHPRLF